MPNMAGILPIWDIREMTCIDFHSQTKRGRWNLNPEHQRDVVHDNIWKSGIINSLLKMNDIPQTYFHTITDKQGLYNFESLDGKQRCNAVIEFLDNNYKFTPNTTLLPRDQCLRGLTYLEFPPLHRQLIENAKLSIKVYPRQMSDEEISEFFLTRQVTRVTTLGEKINAQLQSSLRPQLNYLLQDAGIKDEINTLKKNNDRKAQVELMARLMYAYSNSMLFDTSPSNLISWWKSHPALTSQDIQNIIKLIIKTIQLCIQVPNSWGWSVTAKTTFLPVFKLLQNKCIDESGEFIEKNMQKIAYRISDVFNSDSQNIFGKWRFDVGGNHSISKNRLEEMMIICFPDE